VCLVSNALISTLGFMRVFNENSAGVCFSCALALSDMFISYSCECDTYLQGRMTEDPLFVMFASHSYWCTLL